MGASCTYVASGAWIDHAVMFGSLAVALVGYGILLTLQARRLEIEPINDGEAAEREMAHA